MYSINDRGKLTESIKTTSKIRLGEEISQTELRLYAYIDYCLKNGGRIDPRKISTEEKAIIEKRKNQGHIFVRTDGITTVTRPFYDFMQDVLADAYVLF